MSATSASTDADVRRFRRGRVIYRTGPGNHRYLERVELDRFCAIIPAYNEEHRVGPVVADALRYVHAVLVVDDGSRDRTAEAAERHGAVVVRHETNCGKGVALATGLSWASRNDFAAAITLDGDGQHLPAEIPRFIEHYRQTGADIIVGTRMSDNANMPIIRKATNIVTSIVISCIAGRKITDSQSGFRLLKCCTSGALPVMSSRFAAEPEILVKAARKGLLIREIPITTIYGDEKSKISPVRDTARFVTLALRLIFLDR